MPDDGGYDKPYYSGDVRMGRNKELTDDFTLRKQAAEAIDKSRKSAGSPTTPPDNRTDKHVTARPLSV